MTRAISTVAMKLACLNPVDRRWLLSRLQEEKRGRLERMIKQVTRNRKFFQLGIDEVLAFEGNDQIDMQSVPVGNSTAAATGSIKMFSMLDQYDEQQVFGVFERLSPVVLSVFFSSGEDEWFTRFYRHFPEKGEEVLRLKKDMRVSPAAFKAIERLVHDEINAVGMKEVV